MQEKIERLIADLEGRLKLTEEHEKNTSGARTKREELENMFASGAKEALKYAISELRAVIAH